MDRIDAASRNAVRIAAVTVVVAVLWYAASRIIAPGGEVRVSTDLRTPAPYLTDPKPNGRLAYDRDDGAVLPFAGSPVYLDVAPPDGFDEAEVEVRYHPGDHPVMEIGALASDLDEAYDMRSGHDALLEGLGWNRLDGEGYALYQRRPAFSSVASFLADPPDASRIAVWHADVDAPVPVPETPGGTDVELSLRGTHTLLLSTDGTPVSLRLAVQDMNRQDGADPAYLVIRRDGKEIARTVLADDGDTLGDQKQSGLRELDVHIPDPTPGTYTAEFMTTPDVFIRRLRTSAALAFDGRVYLGDHVGYSDRTPPVTVYATGDLLTARTAHDSALQTIDANGRSLTLIAPNLAASARIDGGGDPVPVTSPKRDVLLETDGVFLLDPAAAFVARPYRLPWYATSDSLDARGIDFVLAPSGLADARRGGAHTAFATFRLDGLAKTPEGKYRFVLHAPGAEEDGTPFSVDDVRFTFRRDVKGWAEGFRRLLARGDAPSSDDGTPPHLLPGGRLFGEHIP